MAAKKKAANDEAVVEKVESKFSKAKLLAAKRFEEKKDVLNAVLSDDEEYTVEAVEQKIKEYYEREVK